MVISIMSNYNKVLYKYQDFDDSLESKFIHHP